MIYTHCSTLICSIILKSQRKGLILASQMASRHILIILLRKLLSRAFAHPLKLMQLHGIFPQSQISCEVVRCIADLPQDQHGTCSAAGVTDSDAFTFLIVWVFRSYFSILLVLISSRVMAMATMMRYAYVTAPLRMESMLGEPEAPCKVLWYPPLPQSVFSYPFGVCLRWKSLCMHLQTADCGNTTAKGLVSSPLSQPCEEWPRVFLGFRWNTP